MVTDKKLNQPRILAKAAETLRQHVGNAVAGDRLRGRLQLIELLAKDLSLGEEQAEHLFWNLVTAGAIVWVGPNGDMRQFGAQNEHWQIDPDTLHPSRFSRIVSMLRHKRPSDDSSGSGDALELLKRAVMARATDVHLDPSGEDVEVRFRIDGRLEHVCLLDRKIAAALISQMKVMAGLDVPDPFRTKEGRIPLPPSLPGWDARITTTRVGAGQAVALRLHNNTHVLRRIASLGLSPGALAEVNRMLHQRDGLILVTGPTGAGKTTTLYSMLHALDDGHRNIVTIEDPIEYQVPSFRQMAVDVRHDITMASGLRTLLRMDPDLVMVGEIRDGETAVVAMRAASSGKHVFTTLHTRDVASTITALRDLHSDNRSLAGNLSAIVSQRLVRRLCQQCRQSRPLTEEERQAFLAEHVTPPSEIWHPVGCTRCRHTGYWERIGVFEVVGSNPETVAAIERGATEEELRQVIRSSGTSNLLADALEKVAAGITSLEEVREVPWGANGACGDSASLATAGDRKETPAVYRDWDPTVEYRVVIYTAPDEIYDLRDVLVRTLNLHPTDAMIRVHATPGILPDRIMSSVTADEVVTAVTSLGLSAEALPCTDIPDFEHAEVVHHVRCLEEGLEILEFHGEEESLVPWSAIELVNVGEVLQGTQHHFVVEPEVMAARRSFHPPFDTKLPCGLEAWVIRKDPLRGYRVQHKHMNYEYLGPRMTGSATHNFRLFVEDIVKWAPHARLTPAACAFLGHDPVMHFTFGSSDELRSDTVFRLLLHHRNETRETEPACCAAAMRAAS